jgi:pimeloyl-ACP methyl ester carboxylesterase
VAETSARWQASDGRLLTATVHPANEHLTATNVAHAAALPVVLLHGLSQQRRFWDPVVARMRSPLIATVDQRGHGDLLLPVDADYGIERCALDVVELLDELGWQQAVVVGHSWGASVALHCAGSGRAAAVGLIDGGLLGAVGPRGPRAGPRATAPPALGIPPASLWTLVESSSPWLGPEARAGCPIPSSSARMA